MSTSQVEKFMSYVSEDAEALKAAAKDAKTPDEFVKNAQQFATERGYDFTVEEARAYIDERIRQSESGELSDAQLNAVAGGATATEPGQLPLLLAVLIAPATNRGVVVGGSQGSSGQGSTLKLPRYQGSPY
jgi:predicted ribosomally synthesized peptide with nif11-like leader